MSVESVNAQPNQDTVVHMPPSVKRWATRISAGLLVAGGVYAAFKVNANETQSIQESLIDIAELNIADFDSILEFDSGTWSMQENGIHAAHVALTNGVECNFTYIVVDNDGLFSVARIDSLGNCPMRTDQ